MEESVAVFHEDPYVHGIACWFRDTYDLSDEVYSHLVYGLDVPVTDDGELASSYREAVAIFLITPPWEPGGLPWPEIMENPIYGLDESESALSLWREDRDRRGDVEVNGVAIDFEEFEMSNDDDEHQKTWWRRPEIERERIKSRVESRSQ